MTDGMLALAGIVVILLLLCTGLLLEILITLGRWERKL